MIYCDTSLIVTAITAEAQTGTAQRWLAEHEMSGLCASLWVETEVASALSQKQRSGLLTLAQRDTAFDRWRDLMSGWQSLSSLTVPLSALRNSPEAASAPAMRSILR